MTEEAALTLDDNDFLWPASTRSTPSLLIHRHEHDNVVKVDDDARFIEGLRDDADLRFPLVGRTRSSSLRDRPLSERAGASKLGSIRLMSDLPVIPVTRDPVQH